MNELTFADLVNRYKEWLIATEDKDWVASPDRKDRGMTLFAEWLEYEIDAKGIKVIQYPNPE
jgi:hypothetical protein